MLLTKLRARQPVGANSVLPSFIVGNIPSPAREPSPADVFRQPPIPMLLGKVGKYRLGGPFYLTTLPTYFTISGITRDSSGSVLAACAVNLFRTSDNAFIDSVVSDTNGNYTFHSPGPATNYYVVAYLAGSPDVSGVTVNTLVGT